MKKPTQEESCKDEEKQELDGGLDATIFRNKRIGNGIEGEVGAGDLCPGAFNRGGFRKPKPDAKTSRGQSDAILHLTSVDARDGNVSGPTGPLVHPQ